MAYMAWLALPKAERRPKTQRDLAKQFDLAEETVSRWKRLPGFAEATILLAREFIKDDVPEVLAVIRREAKKANLPYVNMVLAMAGLGTDIAVAGRGPAPVQFSWHATIAEIASGSGADFDSSSDDAGSLDGAALG